MDFWLNELVIGKLNQKLQGKRIAWVQQQGFDHEMNSLPRDLDTQVRRRSLGRQDTEDVSTLGELHGYGLYEICWSNWSVAVVEDVKLEGTESLNFSPIKGYVQPLPQLGIKDEEHGAIHRMMESQGLSDQLEPDGGDCDKQGRQRNNDASKLPHGVSERFNHGIPIMW